MNFSDYVPIDATTILILVAAAPQNAEIPARIERVLNKISVTYRIVGPRVFLQSQDPPSYS